MEIVIDIKSELDRIDSAAYDYALNGFLNSRLRILIGMWEKGEVIGRFREVNLLSFYEFEKMTGRGHTDLKRWHELYKKYPDKEDYIRLDAEPRALEWTQKALAEKSNKSLVSKFTGDNESYTPGYYIEKARCVMGGIDLDPASNELAQETVKADFYYTEETDGLDKPWDGNIWMNPPYANKLITQFVDKVTTEPISQAVVLTNNNTDTQWFKKLALWADAVCFTTGRINFYKDDGSETAPVNGQTFFYKGNNIAGFVNEFSDVGLIMVMYDKK